MNKKSVRIRVLLLFVFNMIIGICVYPLVKQYNSDTIILALCAIPVINSLLSRKIAILSKHAGMWFCRLIFSYYSIACLIVALVFFIAVVAGVEFEVP